MDTIKVKIECQQCEGSGCDATNPDCDDGLIEKTLPAKYEVCGRCSGKGSHCNPNIDGNGLTREDFEQDPDFKESYFRGDYDVPCHECNGLRVVHVVDTDRLNDDTRKIYDASEKRLAEIAQWDAEDAHTRRMEGGGYDY